MIKQQIGDFEIIIVPVYDRNYNYSAQELSGFDVFLGTKKLHRFFGYPIPKDILPYLNKEIGLTK